MTGDVGTNDGAPSTRSAVRTMTAARILRLPQVCAMTGLGRSMIYQMEAEGRFPPRVNIGVRADGWVESEVQDWLRGRIENRRARSEPRA